MKSLVFKIGLAIVVFLTLLRTIGATPEPEQNLAITNQTIEQLKALRVQDKFTDLPGYDTEDEKNRLQTHLNRMLDVLILGLEKNPQKSWLVAKMKPTIEEIYLEDTEARERFVEYTQQIFGIVGAEVSGSEFSEYMIDLK